MGLIEQLGWNDARIIRQPSGDGAIISFFGEGADAASMIEPYATMLEMMGVGKIIKRTGDIWKGAPGCSLATTVSLKETEDLLMQKMVIAFVRGTLFVKTNPDESSDIASGYIGINPRFIRQALNVNWPDANAIRNSKAMDDVLSLMIKLGYIDKMPSGYSDLKFLDKAASVLGC